MIAKHIDQENCENLLTIAETCSARDVALIMRGEKPAKGTRVILLYLKPRQYKIFATTVLAYGAKKIASGLVDKEAVLIAALSKIAPEEP